MFRHMRTTPHINCRRITRVQMTFPDHVSPEVLCSRYIENGSGDRPSPFSIVTVLFIYALSPVVLGTRFNF